VARIFDVAAMHRLIDADDQEQLKRITDTTALMAREGLLVGIGGGVYKLRDDLIDALSRALHPVPTAFAYAANLLLGDERVRSALPLPVDQSDGVEPVEPD
jgi:butyrate kinase